MTLGDDLRAYIDLAAPPITVAEVTSRRTAAEEALLNTVPSPQGGNGGRHWMAAAATVATVAVAVAVAALVLVPMTRADDDQTVAGPAATDQVTEAVTTSSAPEPFPTTWSPRPETVGAWQHIPAAQAFPPVDANGLPSAQPDTVTAVTAVPGGYVAVGSTGTMPTVRAAAWISPDGRTWTERPLDPSAGATTTTTAGAPFGTSASFASMTAVTSRAGTVVAVGEHRAAAAAGPAAWRWEGDDASTLTLLPFDNPNGSVTMAGVVSTRGGYVAAGTDIFSAGRPGAIVWSSPDGVTWVQAATFDQDVVITSLTALGDRLVAVGSTGGQSPRAAAWFSDDDGRTWTPVELPASGDTSEDSEMISEDSEMIKVAAGGERLLAVSTQGTVAPGGSRTDDAHQIGLPSRATLWSSDDGITWRQGTTVPFPETFGLWRSTLTWGPAGFLVVLSPGKRAWLSPDGATAADANYTAEPWLRATIGTPDGYIGITDRESVVETLPIGVVALPVSR